MNRPKSIVAGAAIATTMVCAIPDARAFVRSATSKGFPTAWQNPSIDLQLLIADPPAYLDAATLSHAVHTAAATWSQPTVACTAIVLNVHDVPDSNLVAASDGINHIGFRRDKWQKIPCTVTATEHCAPYDPAAIAITTVTSRTNTGEIIDADMEINAVTNTFADVLVDGDKYAGVQKLQDLQNTVTHELGHLIGLDHNCYDPLSGAPAPLDDSGMPAPSCLNAPPEIMAATMYSKALERETDKRDLAADDLRAVCTVYPVGYRGAFPGNGADPPDPAGGCAISPAGHAGSRGFGVALSGTLAALVLRAARARRRR